MFGIELKNVTRRFDDVLALDRVDLKIDAGEFFVLLGPSGCGKTTLLRILAGFDQPETGRVVFGERDMTVVPPHERDTGMVFQNYALWPHMTVWKNVEYGLTMRNMARHERDQKVKRALEMVQMSRYAERSPNQLSGGQQQRVALARALVIEPGVVLLDEPLSNLDARLRLEMREQLQDLQRALGVTMIYVTHDQKEALAMGDRIAVMQMAEVAQVGTPRSIYMRPATRFVADFIGEINLISGEITAVDPRGGRNRCGRHSRAGGDTRTRRWGIASCVRFVPKQWIFCRVNPMRRTMSSPGACGGPFIWARSSNFLSNWQRAIRSN